MILNNIYIYIYKVTSPQILVVTMKYFAAQFALLWSGALAIDEFVMMPGHTKINDYSSPLPFEYIKEEDLPVEFNWGDIDGKSYLTRMLNQHLVSIYQDDTLLSFPNFPTHFLYCV